MLGYKRQIFLKYKYRFLCGALGLVGLLLPNFSFAENFLANDAFQLDSTSNDTAIDISLQKRPYIHRLSIEARPEYIIPFYSFFKGNNDFNEYINHSFSAHLQYAFEYQPKSRLGHLYKGAYQGIGLAYYNLGEPRWLGSPLAVYLFQGARLAKLSPRLTLNYEWNFGLSFGWKPYDEQDNTFDIIIGSKTNAYINANLYLSWMLSQQLDLNIGLGFTHFSNGNTEIPNAGLNTTGIKVGIAYNFNRDIENSNPHSQSIDIPSFPKHISYDIVLFGSWRRAGVTVDDQRIAEPDKYTVLGFNFNPMYNFGYKFKAGISLDGVYDTGANLMAEDTDPNKQKDDPKVMTAPFKEQIAVGLSGRAEYVMPYFTIGVGCGSNVYYGCTALRYTYQTVALKIALTDNSFLHIGYNLKNFHSPNYLMLGFGIRLHNKRPSLR